LGKCHVGNALFKRQLEKPSWGFIYVKRHRFANGILENRYQTKMMAGYLQFNIKMILFGTNCGTSDYTKSKFTCLHENWLIMKKIKLGEMGSDHGERLTIQDIC